METKRGRESRVIVRVHADQPWAVTYTVLFPVSHVQNRAVQNRIYTCTLKCAGNDRVTSGVHTRTCRSFTVHSVTQSIILHAVPPFALLCFDLRTCTCSHNNFMSIRCFTRRFYRFPSQLSLNTQLVS